MFARTGASVGKTYLHKDDDADVYFAGFLIRARFSDEHSPEFIYQNTLTDKYNIFIKVMSQRSGQPGVNAQEYSSYSLWIPVIEEQQKLGNFFRTLDDTITLHKRKLNGLKELKRGYLQLMFPQVGERVPRMRFAGFTGDWQVRQLGEHIDDYIEKTTIQNQYPVLTSSQQQGIVFQENYFANRQVTTENNIGYFVLPRGYFTYRSRSDNGVFKINRNDIIGKGIISYFYPVFKIKDGDSDFFLQLFDSSLDKQIAIEAEGTGQRVLSLRKFKGIEVITPEIKEQITIGNFFRNIDEQIAVQQQKLDKMKQLKAAYLKKLFV